MVGYLTIYFFFAFMFWINAMAARYMYRGEGQRILTRWSEKGKATCCDRMTEKKTGFGVSLNNGQRRSDSSRHKVSIFIILLWSRVPSPSQVILLFFAGVDMVVSWGEFYISNK
jgi:hypothetical protein